MQDCHDSRQVLLGSDFDRTLDNTISVDSMWDSEHLGTVTLHCTNPKSVIDVDKEVQNPTATIEINNSYSIFSKAFYESAANSANKIHQSSLLLNINCKNHWLQQRFQKGWCLVLYETKLQKKT